MKELIQQTGYLIRTGLFLLLAVQIINPVSYAAETVRVGFFEKKPLIFTADDGSVQGFGVDALSEIAQQQDWQLTYIAGSLNQTLQRIKQGEIDLMLPVGYSATRDQFIDYTGKQLIDSWGAVYSLKKIPLLSIQQLEGKRVGHLQNSFLQAIFVDYLDDLSISPEYIGVSDYKKLFNGLVSGQYDVAIGDYLSTFDIKPELAKDISQSIMFHPFALFAAATEGDPKALLEPITNYLAMAMANPESNYSKYKLAWMTEASDSISALSIALLIVLALVLLLLLVYLLTRLPTVRSTIGLTDVIQHRVSTNILLLACLLALLSWMVDGFLQFYYAQAVSTFTNALLPLGDPGRLLMRLFIVLIILSSGILTSRVFSRLATQHDISRKQEEHLRTTLNSIGDGVIVTDIEGRVERINPLAEKLTGWASHTATGKPLSDIFKIIQAQTRKPIQNPVTQVIEKGEVVDLASHTVLIARDGKEYQIADSAAPILDQQHNITGVVLVFRDITDEYRFRQELKQNEERLNLALQGANDGVWDWDITNNILHFDSRYYTMAGYQPNEFPSSYPEWEKRLHPEDIETVSRIVNEYISGYIDVFEVEFRFLRKEGNYMWLRGRGKIVARLDDNTPARFIGTHSDITEQKQIEKTLRLSKFSYDKAAVGIYWIGSDGRILEVNERAARMLGYSREEMANMSIFDIDPDVNKENWALVWDSLCLKRMDTFERIHQRKDGSTMSVQIHSNLLEYDKQLYSIAFTQDITARKQAEEETQQNLNHLQAIYNSLPVAIWTLDDEGIFTLSEGKELETVGFQSGELVGSSIFDLYSDSPVALESITKALKGEYCEFETENMDSIYHNVLTPFFDENNIVKGLNGLSINITEKRKVADELRQLQSYLSNVIDSMPSMLVGVDIEGRVTQWNKMVEQITGVTSSDAQGQRLSEMLPWMESEMDKIKKSIRSRSIIQNQHMTRLQENELCYEDVTIYPLVTNGVEGAVIRIDDVTEKVRLEEIMVQSEKMMSVGGLAAGMAHEINNPLAGMIQTANVMANRLGNGLNIEASQKAAKAAGTDMQSIQQFMQNRGILRMLDAITESGLRVANTVDNMLSFARKSDATVSLHVLNEVIDKTLELATTEFDLKKQYDFKLIDIHKQYADDLPAVPCEYAKIQQVLLNLIRNAAQAMQKAKIAHPRITISTHFDKDHKQVCLEIKDNGPGMNEENRKRVFEPFFTTKPVGEGTGLGLSVSYFIITENHSGQLSVQSKPGDGAKFTLYLPLKGTKLNPL